LPADKRIVVNTGPLISLTHGEVIRLLGKLRAEFITTPQVVAELDVEAKSGRVVVPTDDLRVEALANPLDHRISSVVDPGEASVIQLAQEMSVPLVCLDDKKARRLARATGLQLTGSLGLLLDMKDFGLIEAIRPVLGKMLAAGFYASSQLVDRVLRMAGEDI
jgi:predicted nucleic acid-binding protein